MRPQLDFLFACFSGTETNKLLWIVSSPQSIPTLVTLSEYVLGLRRQLGEVAEPSTKKRKLDVVAKAEESNGAVVGVNGNQVLLVTDISFSIPQRKKFSIGIFREGIQILAGQGGEGAKVEAEIKFKDISKFPRAMIVILFELGRMVF